MSCEEYQELAALAPVGSTWYAWGDHLVVTKLTTWDGEPAVFQSARRGRKLVKIPTSVPVRLLLKHGQRTELDG